MERINVTKTFLPPIEEYELYLKQVWDAGQITNQGPLLQELEGELKKRLNVDNLHFVANGTLALQISLKALDISDGEIITTPFSYVATTSAILWERCEPVYVDIDPETLCIDASKIEAAITGDTKAILAVHVFGNPCDVDAIEQIAAKHGLKVIYDAAHAFGVKYKGKSLLGRGDISICSFHATKPFHTIEGGCVITKDKQVSDKVELIKRFGHEGDEHFMLGTNAKATEFQAAMGLCNLKHIDGIIEQRKKISALYDSLINKPVRTVTIRQGTEYNYAYFPAIFPDSERLDRVIRKLNDENIFPRRYFYPSLNTLPYIDNNQPCKTSEDISQRIICLPLYADLDHGIVEKICKIINETS